MVALSGYAQPEDRELALHAGFDKHLPKPVDLETLEHMLQETADGDYYVSSINT